MSTASTQQEQQLHLRRWHHGVIFLFACCVVVSRRPDAIFHAQFWAEDGQIYFADAHNFGWWTALFRPDGGCFHEFPRLGASFALLVPLSLAPLVLNLIAIAAQVLPANLLLFSRSSVWGSLRYRIVMACVYLALPNSWEVCANTANSQCLLALSAFLLLVASVPGSTGGRLFDFSIVLLCGLTGPYCIFLLPIAFFLAWKHRDRWRWVTATVLAAATLVQATQLLILGQSGRPQYSLGASPEWFTRILASQVYLGTLLGSNGLGANPNPRVLVFLSCAAIGGSAIVGICVVKSFLEMRLFFLFSALVFASSLHSALIPPRAGFTTWELLSIGGGIHYWFFPTLFFAWSLLWHFHSRSVAFKIIAGYLLFFMCIAIVRDWRHPAFKDLHYEAYVRQFEDAPSGAEVDLPVNPHGAIMRLVKR